MPTADVILVLDGSNSGGHTLLQSLEKLDYRILKQVDRVGDLIQVVSQTPSDLVLIDMQLQDQAESLRIADQLRRQYGIPVIFISSFADAAFLQRLRTSEPLSYIIKPFEDYELDSLISTVLYKYNSEKRLRQSEEKFHTLFNIMAQGVVYQLASGEIVSANPAAERILGMNMRQLQGMSFTDPRWRTIQQDGTKLPAELRPPMQVIKTGQAVDNVILGIYHSEKAEYVWIRVHSRPQYGPGGKQPVMVVSTFEDITDIKNYQDGLAASEARYRSVVETSPDGITLTDLQGKFLAANRQALEMQGFSSFDELQESGLTSFDFIDASHWLCEPGRLEQELLAESPRRVEYDFRRRDGSIFVADASMSLLRDAANQPNAILSINRDITDRKRSEAQLRKLSQAVMQSGDNIVITDLKGSIEYVNPQFEETTGYSLAEAIGKNPSILKSGEQSDELYAELWKTITSGQIWRGELHNKRRDGSLYWEYVSISPVTNEAGKITNFVAIKKDITESKKLEQTLRIKESAINSSINAMALADLHGRLTYVNPAFVKLWGTSHFEENLGKDLRDFWVDPEPVAKILATLNTDEGWQGELNARKKNGSIIVVDVSMHLVKDESGYPLCIMSSFVDITARKNAEEAERAEHRLVEALRKTGEALSSTLNLDDVLERILENAGDVIDNDAMTIMLLEDDNLRVMRHRGYTQRGITDYIENTKFKIDDFSTLREMIDTRQPSIISDVKNTPFWISRPATEWIRSYAGVPICKRDKVIGFLNLESATPNHFTADQASRMQAFASQAAIAIENASLYEQDHILSITDGLTDLYNNRYFYELTHLEFERTLRYPGQLSMLMIDIDHFKRVNDTYGHMVGDDVLRETAHRVRACLRSVDLAARYGGEEFAILMTQTNEHDAYQVAERIHASISELPFIVSDIAPIKITISLGIVTLAEEHKNFKMLIKNADDALYAAKNAGRNQISIWKSKL